MNEAIYPFYLFHQPAILIIGYFSLSWGLADGFESVLLIVLSLAFIIGVYILVSQFNVTRVMFGLRLRKRAVKEEVDSMVLTSERVDA